MGLVVYLQRLLYERGVHSFFCCLLLVPFLGGFGINFCFPFSVVRSRYWFLGLKTMCIPGVLCDRVGCTCAIAFHVSILGWIAS
jgi:hypothetical protein